MHKRPITHAPHKQSDLPAVWCNHKVNFLLSPAQSKCIIYRREEMLCMDVENCTWRALKMAIFVRS